MNTLKPKARQARKKAPAAASAGTAPAQPQAVNPYLMSVQAAVEAVRRAGIVTPAGKLSRIYK